MCRKDAAVAKAMALNGGIIGEGVSEYGLRLGFDKSVREWGLIGNGRIGGVMLVWGGDGGVTSWGYLANGANKVPPGIDRGEEETGGVDEGNGLGEVDGSIGFGKAPGKGSMDGIEVGLNNGCLFAKAAMDVSFAASIDKWWCSADGLDVCWPSNMSFDAGGDAEDVWTLEGILLDVWIDVGVLPVDDAFLPFNPANGAGGGVTSEEDMRDCEILSGWCCCSLKYKDIWRLRVEFLGPLSCWTASLFMPTSAHLFKRHALHWLRWVLSTRQLPSVLALQTYCRFRLIERWKIMNI